MHALAQFLRTYKWAILLLAVAGFLFYWYEVRPIRVYRSCALQSSIDARKLLASKAEIAEGTDKGRSYQGLMDRNMYLRSDYESFLQKCLLHYGMQLTDVRGEPPAESVPDEEVQ